jgi:hypothetical protein
MSPALAPVSAVEGGTALPFDELPSVQAGGGFIYIIQFSNGTVKVGSTFLPSTRFRTHQSNASAFAVTIERWWTSGELEDYVAAEDRLIELAASLGGRRARREYFHDIDYDTLVGLVEAAVPGVFSAMPADPKAVRAEAWDFAESGDRESALVAMMRAGLSEVSAQIMIDVYMDNLARERAGAA